MNSCKWMLATLGLAWTLTALAAGNTDSLPTAPAPPGLNASEMVAAHNTWRAEVGVGPLTYSDTLAASAQAWADKLKSTKNCAMKHSSGPEGENLYWASAWSSGQAQSISPAKVVNAWASEKADYSHASNSCAAGKVCGHYTQVVWKNTTSVGCGMAVCESPKNQVWVCQYLPAGNYVGQKPY